MSSTYIKIKQIIACSPYLKGFDPSTMNGILDYYYDRGDFTSSQSNAVNNVYTRWNIEYILENPDCKPVFPEKRKRSGAVTHIGECFPLPEKRPRSGAVSDIRDFFSMQPKVKVQV